MKLKKHGAFLLDFVLSYADGKIDRWGFDMDYSGYVIAHFPSFVNTAAHLSHGTKSHAINFYFVKKEYSKNILDDSFLL